MTFRETLEAAGREYVLSVLNASGGRVAKAAGVAGMHRAALYKLMRRYGIPVQRKVREKPVIRIVRLMR